MPYFFAEPVAWTERTPHLAPLFAEPSAIESHFDYFRLCLCAHHASVASFVPTDVDNQIRHRLWHPALSVEETRAMATLVLESRRWDCRPVSTRWVQGPESGKLISGHDGEWFSTAVGAYGALRKKAPADAELVLAEIQSEIEQEAALFAEMLRLRDGLNALRVATLIAHNLGDLERVIEMWGMRGTPVDLKLDADSRLNKARELNKAKMAAENHRNFALRKPRCLRQSPDFLLPLGPFYDDWGSMLARHPLLAKEEIAEVVEALLEGLERTPGSIGYTRALAGIEQTFRGGAQALQSLLTAREARKLKAGPLRALIAVPKAQFEKQWAQYAIQLCK